MLKLVAGAHTEAVTSSALPQDSTRATRSTGLAGAFFLSSALVLVLTAAVLLLAGLHHFAGTAYPVLPTSWCRNGNETALPPLTGSRWVSSWQFDDIAVVGVSAVAVMYVSGLIAVRLHGRHWPARRAVTFFAGLAVVVVATCGPISVYDMAMFSTHMLGHLALVMVAPPLLVLGRPLTLALHATRNPWHRRIRAAARGRMLAFILCPPVALACYAVVIVGTHLTGLMNQIMTRPWAGQLEHAVYLVVGCQFFVLVIGDEPLRWKLSMPAKELLLAVAMAIDTFTGVVLLQSTQPITMMGLSPTHVDPLAQTRLGGAVMWVGGDLIMAVVMIGIGIGWVRRPAYRRGSRRTWIEQTRRAVFDEHTTNRSPSTVASAAGIVDIDDDDRARTAYNDWLARLDGGRRG